MSGLGEGQCRASPHLPAKPGRNHTGTKGNGGAGEAMMQECPAPSFHWLRRALRLDIVATHYNYADTFCGVEIHKTDTT